ncbi:ProQ/FINO family protein [Ensifer sp. BR816]|uniref:ProQ/FINO family protein n=1 Tax=Rhizobium sp. (strain BR816) TaxID=1057002 RepID=UPI00037FF6D9|nr:ProQ/FinO family protein [Ensifer sp. BR816]
MVPTEKHSKSASALFRHLSEKWPNAFNAKLPKPLKIGIRQDIRALDGELSDEELGRALRAYTRTDKYLANMRAGAARVDLNGNPAGEVSEGDATTAQAWLRVRGAKEVTAKPKNPKAEPEQPPKSLSTQVSANKTKLAADRTVIVETKRRRPTERRFDRR